jgi:hypothetical protein
MFGKSEKGQATIVARQMHEGLYKMKGATGIYRNIWDYIADVVPDDGGETFRATFTEIFEGFQGRQPDVGQQAPVTFDKTSSGDRGRAGAVELEAQLPAWGAGVWRRHGAGETWS